MKERMKKMIEAFHKYNSENMAYQTFGFDSSTEYDALVVAPSFTPYRLGMDNSCQVTTLRESSYLGGYLVEKDNLKIAWIKVASSDSNTMDHIAVCTELKFKKMIFIGAVGALKPSFTLGDICTPSYSVAGGYTNTYLKESIKDFVPFEKVYPDGKYIDKIIELAKEKDCEIKKASVFCTPTVAMEYYHLDEIKEFDTDLIEMETGTFYLMADMLEVPAAALLVVSDNSATGAALVGRTDEEQEKYDFGRKVLLPRMVMAVAAME